MISRAIVALHAVITCAEALIVQRSRVGIHNAFFPDTDPGVSVMFPGFGEPDRIPLMKEHVQWLRRQNESFDCTIYVYKSEEDFPLDSADFDPCTIARHVGGQFMDHYKAFKPSKPLILVWIDAVDIDPRASLTRMIRVAEANELDHLGVGDRCWAGGNRSTRERNPADGVGREYYGVDFEFDLFHADAFQCLQSIIDADLNPFGWGVGIVFPWACKVKQGIWDEVAWNHASHKSYDYKAAEEAHRKYMRKFKKLGWTKEEVNQRHTIRPLVDPDKPNDSSIALKVAVCRAEAEARMRGEATRRGA